MKQIGEDGGLWKRSTLTDNRILIIKPFSYKKEKGL